MLYWAEGAKSRNTVAFSNSDMHMVSFMRRFLTACFDADRTDFTLALNVYTGNGLSLDEIENRWLRTLELPRSCLRGHMLNHKPTSSSGLRPHRLPYGVATLKLHSTKVVQHIYGAIQEYGGFDEPRWLDC